MIELRGVTAGYGSHTVLRNVSLIVPDRSVVALLGANGAGKTTLLRVVSGLLEPQSGQVIVDGNDVTGWPPHRRARAGMSHIPEGRGIFRSLSVRDNLRLQAPRRRDLKAVAVATRTFPRLGERLTQRAETMSGGEQQMLAISRAYLGGSSIVLLDEVSMGLAPKIVDEIYQHLRLVAGQGTAMLLVEQYVGRALEMSDYVYVLNKGRVAFAGEPRQLRSEEMLTHYLGG